MENITPINFYISKEESKDIIELLAKKRNIKNYKSKFSHRLHHNLKIEKE